ncbi:MAG TPA: ABC transporter permease [Candidatus Margulisiibacteriota bacterium]|nr:ABC transporter permease [Candidatus Margulisiibacteriota bacterium]
MNLGSLLKKLKVRTMRLFARGNRRLMVELVWAELKLADQNSILGFLWSCLNPVLMLLIMYFIFKFSFSQKIPAYPLYLLVGIACVNFFIATTTYSTKVFSINRDFILNTTVPREMVVLSRLFVHTYKFIIELALCLILSFVYGVFSGGQIFLLLPLLLSYMALILSFSFLLSLLYCFVRDIEHIWMLLSRLFLFVTPIFYKLESVSLLFRNFIYWANPITPYVISFHEIIIKGGNLNLYNYLYALVLGLALLILSYSIFLAIENFALERS